MARLEVLPEQWVIDKFKGTVDFYLWNGIPVARKWPQHRPRTPSPEELATQTRFRYIINIISDPQWLPDQLWKEMAKRRFLTWRDLAIRGYLSGTLFTCDNPTYNALPLTNKYATMMGYYYYEDATTIQAFWSSDIITYGGAICTFITPYYQETTKLRRGNLWYRDYLILLSQTQLLPDSHWTAPSLYHLNIATKPDRPATAYWMHFFYDSIAPPAPSARWRSSGPLNYHDISYPWPPP